MKKPKNVKEKIPLFASEKAESDFWDRVDSTDYFPSKGSVRLQMPKRTKNISLRLPQRLIDRLKKLAALKDVPYQSLLKVYLDEKVREEISLLARG